MTTDAPAHHRVRAGQPVTAVAAAIGTATQQARRATILDAVAELLHAAGPAGMTDDELAAELAHLTPRRHSVATRRHAWVRDGHAAPSDRTRPNELGNPCTVWVWVGPPPAQAATGPRPGSRGARGGPPTPSAHVVDVALLAQPLLADYCAVCGALEDAPHWAGCPAGDRAPVDEAGRLARLERVLFTSPTLFDA
jgi:hypothetical protein